MAAMQWPLSTIWWHVYPLRFTGAERTAVPTVHHRLAQLTDWLPYARDLGCNGLLLGPVFSSASHGYDTLDYFTLDRRLGDNDDLEALIAAAKAHGFRLLFDGVFNHVGRGSSLVTDALTGGPHSPAGRMVRWSGEHLWYFEGHDQLVELDHSNDDVVALITDVMCHWLERGIDGWRLDAAYAAGASAWRPIADAVHDRFPEAWLMGEVIHGDYATFVAESGLDSVTQYELWKATWSSLDAVNMYELEWTLGRHAEFCTHFAPLTFIGNHDVTRIASKLTDPRHLGHAIALLALLPGVPAVYSGDEQGFTGVKEDNAFGDDAVRPRFPATPDELAPFGRPIMELHQRLLGMRRRHPWLWTAQVATRDVRNDSLVIELAPADGTPNPGLELTLNLADEPRPAGQGQVLASSEDGARNTPAHGWTLTQR